MCFSSPLRLPKPRCSACCGVTINPAPCMAIPREHKPSFESNDIAEATSAPIVKPEEIRPRFLADRCQDFSPTPPLGEFQSIRLFPQPSSQSEPARLHRWP